MFVPVIINLPLWLEKNGSFFCSHSCCESAVHSVLTKSVGGTKPDESADLLFSCWPVLSSFSLALSHFLTLSRCVSHFLHITSCFFLMCAIKLDGFVRQSQRVIGLNGPSSSHLYVLFCSWAFDYACPPLPTCHPWIGIAQTVPAELAEKKLFLYLVSPPFHFFQIKGRAVCSIPAASKEIQPTEVHCKFHAIVLSHKWTSKNYFAGMLWYYI